MKLQPMSRKINESPEIAATRKKLHCVSISENYLRKSNQMTFLVSLFGVQSGFVGLYCFKHFYKMMN